MIKIRNAGKDDISDLQNLNNEIFIDNQKYTDDLDINWAKSDKGKTYFTELLNNPKAYCSIAELDGKKIGYLAAEPKEIEYLKSKYIEIETIGVDSIYRSKGIGSQLIQVFFKWAKKAGYQKAYVNPYSKNLKAIEFYKDNGFWEIDVSFEKNL